MARSKHSGVPVTKCMLFVCTAATLAILSSEPGHGANISANQGGFVSHLLSIGAFGSLSDLLCGTFLMHTYRTLERQMGSKKLSSLLLFVTILSSSATWALTIRFPNLRIRTGPLHILGALWAYYYAYVPELQPFENSPILHTGRKTVHLSNKSLAYLSAAYLIFGHQWKSFVPSAIGIVAACLYGCPKLPFRRFFIPSKIGQVLCKIMHLFKSSDDHSENSRRQMLDQYRRQLDSSRRQNQESGANLNRGETLLSPINGFGMNGQEIRRRIVAPTLAVPPSEEALSAIMSLGFDRVSAEQALQQTNNNIDAAAAQLLGI